MKVDGIIFDIDGTIWDATEMVIVTWNRALENTGDSFRIDSSIKKQFGKTIKQIFRDILPEEYSDERKQMLADAIIAMEQESLFETPPKVYEGFQDVVKDLARDHKLFVISNCQPGYLEKMLEITGVGEYITDFAGPSHTGLDKPGNIRRMADLYDLKRGVYLGDIEADRIATETAGLTFIWAAYGFGDVPDAKYRVNDIRELPELIRNM